jgi:hypothetical protein
MVEVLSRCLETAGHERMRPVHLDMLVYNAGMASPDRGVDEKHVRAPFDLAATTSMDAAEKRRK